MQQRRPRLGDILDDYCPRERRLTNHVVVAMIDDEVRQTRCSTCDADHEYKAARVPPRKKKEGALVADPGGSVTRPRSSASEPEPLAIAEEPVEKIGSSESFEAIEAEGGSDVVESEADTGPAEDDGPVHRRLIRATFPRPEGQAPERKVTEFTVRQPGGARGDGHGNRQGSGRGRGHVRGQSSSPGQPPHRFGGSPHGNQRQGAGQGPGHGQPGNRIGSGRSGQGQGRGQQGGGSGRKRGR